MAIASTMKAATSAATQRGARTGVASSITSGSWQKLPRRQQPHVFGVGTGVFARAGAVRHIRAGFFPEDEDYIDPEGPLLAERLGSRWRYMDDESLRAPVLERSNVGMGMVVLNRAAGLDLPAINTMYTKLRNLEVNSLKRFVGLTAVDPGPFCEGLDPKELLLVATAAARRGRLPRFARALLWHHQELAHLIADYRKPLVTQLSGPASDGGAALACLANFAGAHEDSQVVIRACQEGLVPIGGMTYLLGRLPYNLGEFLALTGWPLHGADLVYTGLARHWLSPDALPFLELTAEKHLEVSETDSRALLDEHSLPLPGGLGDDDSLPRRFIPLIQRAFGPGNVQAQSSQSSSSPSQFASVPGIMNKLQTISRQSGAQEKAFAENCLERMSQAAPLALHASLRLVQLARRDSLRLRRRLAEEAEGKNPQTRNALLSRQFLGAHGQHGPLVDALRRELRVQERLIVTQDAVMGLHARCLGRPSPGEGSWSRRNVKDVLTEEVDDLLEEAQVDEPEEFAVCERSEMSLSAHPRLRRFHPEFDPHTGLDHDPAWMEAEVRRWSPDLFAEERRRTVDELLRGRGDPADFGVSRWTRVEEGRPL